MLDLYAGAERPVVGVPRRGDYRVVQFLLKIADLAFDILGPVDVVDQPVRF